MKLFINLMIILTPALVLAADNGHGEAHAAEVPKVVLYQLINIVILMAGLVYFTKDKIVSFFAERKAAYAAAAEKSAFAREQAEREFVDIKTKLSQLETTRAESLRKAQVHAAELKKQVTDEASAVSKRISEDAHLTAKLEIERAQRDLRTQLLKDSVDAARLVLTKDIGAADQAKLQKDFINHVGV